MRTLATATIALITLTSTVLAGPAVQTPDSTKPLVLADDQMDKVTGGVRPDVTGAACFVPCGSISQREAPISKKAKPEAVILPYRTVR